MISQVLLDALPLGVLVTDHELNLLQVNRWLIERLTADQLARVGEPLGTVFPELLELNLLAAFELVLRQGQRLTLPGSVHRFLLRLPAPAGSGLSEMAQAITIAPLFEGAVLAGTLTFIQDISQGLSAERQLQREIDRLSALHEVDRALATLDLAACLQVIVDRTRTLFGGGNAALLLHEAGQLRVAASAGFSVDVLGQRVPLDTGVVGRVACERRPILVADVAEEPGYLNVDPRTRSEMAAPLLLGGDCLGVLNVESEEVNAYGADDLEILEMLGGRAAIALHNAWLHAAEREQRELAATLADIGLRLASELDPEAILDTLLDHVARVVPYDSACVLMLDAAGQRVRVERMRNYERYGVTHLVMHFQQELAVLRNMALMAESHRPHTVPDVKADRNWKPHESAAHIRSWAGAPILARGRVLGFLSLDKTETGYYTPAMADRLAGFAAQAGLALENARLYAEQQRLAVTDGLTGVGNRRYFDQVLPRELQRALRFRHTTALIMLDIDDFKRFNDRYGHLAGDELLRVLAAALAETLRSTDTLVRYGGEEFVIILPETELEAAHQAAERLRLLVRALPLLPPGSRGGPVTISLGVSAAPQHADTPTRLVNAADVALYAAKARGKNQTVVFDDALL